MTTTAKKGRTVADLRQDRMERLGLCGEHLGYVDGMDLYEVDDDNPINRADPKGLLGARSGPQAMTMIDGGGGSFDFGTSAASVAPKAIQRRAVIGWERGEYAIRECDAL
jgi:hypothetical protein